MSAPPPAQLLPPIPRGVRFAIAGLVIGMLVYSMTLLEAPAPTEEPEPPPATTILVPELDETLLREAKDDTREQRLQLEVEPLRHLLGKAMDVGPTVAVALGMPSKPVPVAVVREQLPSHRRRWLYYEGVLEELTGPREGHPIRGYSIYEATVKLADGERVLTAFSLPPAEGVRVGSWVRVEGYLLKLRDTTYPTAIEKAPMLVGRSIQLDYEDWPPVTKLDQALLDKVDDSSVWPGDLMWHTVDEDQTEALWHLAAFVRDTENERTLEQWRRIGTLNAAETHEKLKNHEVPRGTPMRVFGSLIRRTFLAAPTNPAGIQFWTIAWVQVREYGAALVPIWIPKRLDTPTRAQLEVRGFYYRWFAYETTENKHRRVPLFVAADLNLYELHVDHTMQAIGMWLGGAVIVFLGLIFWTQRRAARAALLHSHDMDRRRRRRRERGRPAPAPLPPTAPPAS